MPMLPQQVEKLAEIIKVIDMADLAHPTDVPLGFDPRFNIILNRLGAHLESDLMPGAGALYRELVQVHLRISGPFRDVENEVQLALFYANLAEAVDTGTPEANNLRIRIFGVGEWILQNRL